MNTRSMLLLVAAGIASLGVTRAQDPLATRLKASDPATWKPVPYQAEAPTGGVTLDDKGLFKPVMDNNIEYLLNSFPVDHMLVPFRERAGIKDPPSDGKPQVEFWETSLRGSCAGRFLMGAGGTLRWIEHPELRQRMNQLIDGIEACRRPDGYVLAFPPDATRSEEPNYGRAWFTHGLIEAGIAGNPKAFELLRGHADWFNQWDLLPKLTTICNNAQQGYIASTRTYFSPVGKPEDIQVAEKYWVQDWWVKRLAARDLTAIWQYPKPTPHSYLIVSFESYLDQYRATGEKPFLDATLGAWEMITKHWQHVGGSMAICEDTYPPDTIYISQHMHTGETCGNVFWIKFNQRFHQLYPDEETYANEIEKSIYNVLLPNQDGAGGIRYHCRMEGQRDAATCDNTCCELQGARLFGSLPEYIFSTARDGLYVNLFEPSSIRWNVADQDVSLTMNTRFPQEPKVELKLGAAKPVAMKLRVRVPSWAAADMPVMVNGKQTATGKPGSYVLLDRTWADGDKVTFTLPMGFRATRYTGVDQIQNHTRYALEYGPILLAAAGPLDDSLRIRINQSPDVPAAWLQAKPDAPLHFTVKDHPDCEFMPCWDLGQRTYTCYPIVEPLTIEGLTPFPETTEVKIISAVPGAVIRYTTDGSEPTAQSPTYSGTLKLDRSCLLSARIFAGGNPHSPAVGRRFLCRSPEARGTVTVPQGLKAGDRYRLVFVTSTKTWAFPGADPAAPKSLDDYNAFATKTATAVPALSALGTTWQAVVSVSPANGTPVSAKSNTKTDPAADGAGVPVYNLAGALVATNYADLWDGTIQNPIDMTELGTSPPDQGGDKHLVWTGATSSGDATGWSLLVPNSWKYFGNAMLTDTINGNPTVSWIASLGPQQGWPWDGGTEKTPMPIYVMSGILTAK